MKKILIILILGLILISGCSKQGITGDAVKKLPVNFESPEIVAERFARYWEQKDWDSMYNMFIPELKAMKPKERFSKIMDFLETTEVITVRLDKISEDNEKVYAYFTATTELFESKLPAFEMQNREGEWKFNAFAKYFGEHIVVYEIIEHISHPELGEDVYVLISPEDKSETNAISISKEIQEKFYIKELCNIKQCNINIYSDKTNLQSAIEKRRKDIYDWELAGRMLIPGR